MYLVQSCTAIEHYTLDTRRTAVFCVLNTAAVSSDYPLVQPEQHSSSPVNSSQQHMKAVSTSALNTSFVRIYQYNKTMFLQGFFYRNSTGNTSSPCKLKGNYCHTTTLLSMFAVNGPHISNSLLASIRDPSLSLTVFSNRL